MIIYPNIDPIAFTLGPVEVRWYGLMYLVAFLSAWLIMTLQAKRLNQGWTSTHISDLVFYGALGVILGGRLGYILFYDFAAFIDNPIRLFHIWQGGMSFHGGLIGVIVALWLYGRSIDRSFFQVMDFIAPAVPIGLGAGRIGNFLNSELWGRVSDVPWAMVFPNGGPLPRHPSMLYEALLEGLVLFIILWIYAAKPRPTMAISGLFLILYGAFRSLVEFFREPDMHIGFIAFDWLTLGQLLSLPMIVIGGYLLRKAYHPNPIKQGA